MARKPKKPRQVRTLTHGEASRKNIPTAEHQSVMAKEDQDPIEVAWRRRNRDLDPQLVWRGKDVEDWSNLVVQAPPLYIQEKVHPKALIDDLVRRSRAGEQVDADQPDLFADFNGLPDDHSKHRVLPATTPTGPIGWSWATACRSWRRWPSVRACGERSSASISIRPTASSSTPTFSGQRPAAMCKDGKSEHITREPEQVKAYPRYLAGWDSFVPNISK